MKTIKELWYANENEFADTALGVPREMIEDAYEWREEYTPERAADAWWGALELLRKKEADDAKTAASWAIESIHEKSWFAEQARREEQEEIERHEQRQREQDEALDLARLAESALGIQMRPNYCETSWYGTRGIVSVRVSTHPQRNGQGGWNEGTGEHYDASDVSFLTGEDHTRESIRAAVAAKLNELR